MKLISDLVDTMMEEVHDAKHRIKKAYELKAEYPEIAKREYDIAVQELMHADKDHASAVELITAYRKSNGEPPADMLAIWNEKHEKYMDKYAKVKVMIDGYNK